MKMNCKGFVLLETLIVAVFVVFIFTFLYTTIIPLLGTYEDLTNKNNIDVVYKLYHIRKSLYNDTNYNTIINNQYGKISCNNYTNQNYCLNLISSDYINLLDGYEIIYVKDINNYKDNLYNIEGLSDELYEYIKNYDDDLKNVIFLYDYKLNSVAHLGLALDLNRIYNYNL